MTANDAHCVEPKCQCVEGTMRIVAHWASHEQQKCKIANFHTLGISNKHVHKTCPCAPKTRICACALCAIGLRWHYRRWAQCPPTKINNSKHTAIVLGISNVSILKCVVHQKVVDQNHNVSNHHPLEIMDLYFLQTGAILYGMTGGGCLIQDRAAGGCRATHAFGSRALGPQRGVLR